MKINRYLVSSMRFHYLCILLWLFIPVCCRGNTSKVKIVTYMPQADTYSQQGAAVFGNYLFQFSAIGVCDIYDLQERNHVGQMKYESSQLKHCDTVCFGSQKVETKDEFPVIYVSGALQGMDAENGIAWVYRILHNGLKWSLQLVQELSLPTIDQIWSCPDVALSNVDGCMLVMGWNSDITDKAENGGGAYLKFTKFHTPRISSGENIDGFSKVHLSMDDAITSFVVNNAHTIQQGICLKDNYVFVPYGEISEGYQGIDVISLEQCRVEKNINLMHTSVKEPEAVFFYNNELYIADQATSIKRVISVH